MKSNRDLFMEVREVESTPYCHCNKCNITWAKLETISSDADDEQYDVCPNCLSEWYLMETDQGPAHIMSAITGQVINLETKQELKNEPVPLPPSKKGKPFILELWKQKLDAREEVETRALEVYQDVYKNEGKQAAELAYKKVFSDARIAIKKSG